MQVREAVQLLADGHSIVPVGVAQDICTTLRVQLPERLVLSWLSALDAYQRYGFYTLDRPGSGVELLALSYEVCRQLGITDPPGSGYYGVGTQARVNSQAIAQVLSQHGVL